MWRYVLKENILRFNALLGQAPNEDERAKLRQLVEQAEAELRELEEASTPDIARTDAALKFFAERAIGEAQKLSGANFSTLQIRDGSRERLVILAQSNFRAPFLHHLEQMRPGDGSASGRCIADNAPAAIDDVNSDPEFEPHRKAAKEAGFRAVQAFPVRNGSGRLIAVLSSYFSEPQSSAEADLSQTARFAESLGAELEKYLQR
jgi:GAF domain-containing protein